MSRPLALGTRVPSPRAVRARMIASVTLVALIAPLVIIAGSSRAAAAEDVTFINPFEPAGGFSVYARGDADLGNTELEGSLAVGGTLSNVRGSTYSIIAFAAGTHYYAPPLIDGDVTRLLFQQLSTGSANFDVTGAGAVVPATAGFVKVVDPQPGTFEFVPRGDFTRYNAIGNTSEQGPLIDAKNQPYVVGDPSGSFLTEQGSVAAYTEDPSSVDFATIDACLAGLDSQESSLAAEASVAANGAGNIEITLVEGVVNYVDYAELDAIDPNGPQVQYAGAQPSASTPLVVRVYEDDLNPVTGYELTMPDTGEDLSAPSRFVMWDFSRVTSDVRWQAFGNQNARTSGSIYAPHANMTMTFAPHDGGVIVNDLETVGSGGGSGAGELHAFTFLGRIPCGGADTPLTDLTVSKTIEGVSSDAPDFEFEVSVLCEYADQIVLEETVLLQADAGATFTDLPVGADCVITETGAGGSSSQRVETTTASGTQVFPGAEGSIELEEGAGANTVEVVNIYVDEATGTLALSKVVTVDGDPDAPWPGSVPDEVTVHVACVAPDAGGVAFEFDVTVPTDGTSLTWDDVPVGTACTVTEDGDFGQSAVSFLPADATAVAEEDATTTVTVVNDYSTTSISLRKIVEESASGVGADAGPFAVVLECSLNGEAVYATSGPAGYVPGSPMEVDLVPGAPAVTFAGLPLGAECFGVERDPSGASEVRVEIIDGSGGTVALARARSSGRELANGPYDVTITNAYYDTGVSSLALGLSGDGSALSGDDDSSVLTVGEVATVWDQVTVEGWVPEGSSVEASLYAIADLEAPVCEPANEIDLEGPRPIDAQREDASATYELDEFATQIEVSPDVAAYTFVERIVTWDGGVLAESECGDPLETFAVLAPAPTPEPTPSPTDTAPPAPDDGDDDVAGVDDDLAQTGGGPDWRVPVAAALLVVGAGLVIGSRRYGR